MMTQDYIPQQQSYLAGHRLPPLSFSTALKLPASLSPSWEACNGRDYRLAISRAQRQLSNGQIPADEHAALLVVCASAELRLGGTARAKTLAGRSIDIYPRQWSAHRILLSILNLQQAYQGAYQHLINLPMPGPVPVWDEPLARVDQYVALASWSWMMGQWEDVAEHLLTAYPAGIASMPIPLMEDWFRLALYRGRPEDAAAVAALLIERTSVESADALLQTIVQNGWTKEALPLYRTAFANAPKSQLLRRRLVALCIREGKIDEARQLTQPGALGLAA